MADYDKPCRKRAQPVQIFDTLSVLNIYGQELLPRPRRKQLSGRSSCISFSLSRRPDNRGNLVQIFAKLVLGHTEIEVVL